MLLIDSLGIHGVAILTSSLNSETFVLILRNHQLTCQKCTGELEY